VHKVQHKPTKKVSWGTLQSLEQIQYMVQPVAHRTLSGVPVAALANWPLSSFLRATIIKFTGLFGVPPDCSVCHRTVRWANGATVNFANGRLCWRRNSEQCRSRTAKSKRTGVSGVPLDCPVPQEDKWLQRSTTPNPNGWLTWHAPDNDKCYVRCAYRQQSQPTARKCLEAINTPNHLHSSHPSLPHISFNTRAKNTLQRHNQSIQSPTSSKIKSSA
jgi:hypothetical protein